MVNAVPGRAEPETCLIANGQSVSTAPLLGGRIITGVYMPSGWTAAGLSFQVSIDGSAWASVYTATAEFVATVAAGLYIAIDPMIFRGATHVRLRSGVVALPVAQLADRTVTLMLTDPSFM